MLFALFNNSGHRFFIPCFPQLWSRTLPTAWTPSKLRTAGVVSFKRFDYKRTLRSRECVTPKVAISKRITEANGVILKLNSLSNHILNLYLLISIKSTLSVSVSIRWNSNPSNWEDLSAQPGHLPRVCVEYFLDALAAKFASPKIEIFLVLGQPLNEKSPYKLLNWKVLTSQIYKVHQSTDFIRFHSCC